MKTKTITFSALAAAAAVAVNAAEGLLPAVPFLPPGARLGLSNVITMLAAERLGLAAALAASAVKSLFVLLTRGFTAFLMSLAGGLISTLICGIMLRKSTGWGYVGIGIIGAVLHNCAQSAVCPVWAGSAILYYLPFLAAASVVTGGLSGALLAAAAKYIPREITEKGDDPCRMNTDH